MKRVLSSCLLLVALALPASGQEVSQRAAALLDVLIENGCEITKAEAVSTLPAMGFPRREYRKLMKELKDAGRVVLSEGAARLADGECPSTAPELVTLLPFQEMYISVLRHNGCQVQADEAGPLFTKYGMEANLAAELEEGLVDSGVAIITDGTLSVGPEYCIAVDDFPTLPFLELSYGEQHLVEILETGSCTLVQSQIEVSFPQDSMQPAEAQAAVETLLASGVAQAVTDGDRIWLSLEVCRPWSERES